MTLCLDIRECQRGSRRVLRDLRVEIPCGTIATILGANGAGKSSLLRCIAGLESYEGGVTWNGTALKLLGHRERAKLVTYVPQDFSPIYACSVYQFVALSRYSYLGIRGVLAETDRMIVEDSLRLLRLEALSARNICELSGGELRRVLLASSVAQQAPLLLLDEPTADLDPVGQIETQELLQMLVRKRGVTVLQVMHDVNLAASRSALLLGMRTGELLLAAAPAQWLCQETLSAVYGRALPLVAIPGRDLPAVIPP